MKTYFALYSFGWLDQLYLSSSNYVRKKLSARPWQLASMMRKSSSPTSSLAGDGHFIFAQDLLVHQITSAKGH